MRTFVICLAFALIAYASATAIPDYDGPTYDLVPIEDSKTDADSDVQAPVRARRLTCDLFSFTSKWFSPNHMACATKCLFQGRRGGACRDGRCVCRR